VKKKIESVHREELADLQNEHNAIWNWVPSSGKKAALAVKGTTAKLYYLRA